MARFTTLAVSLIFFVSFLHHRKDPAFVRFPKTDLSHDGRSLVPRRVRPLKLAFSSLEILTAPSGGATNIRAVGEEAARLHQSFLGALEFPERLFPQLAGRKMFWVEYSDVEAQDVETIRQDLCRNLKYENTPAVNRHLALLPPFSLHTYCLLTAIALALELGLSQEMPMGLTIFTPRLLDQIIFVSVFNLSRSNITRL